MANLISFADGNLTAAGTWETTDSTALVEPATVGSTALTAGNQDSAVFQPGAITVDGVAIRLASRATGTPTNTMTVTLRNSSAGSDVASVTVNVSDLAVCTTADLDGGWYFFKFSASQLLLAATNYVIRISLSATTTAVSIATNNTAANWLHMLRTTTTQAPAAGDNMHVMGEFDGASNPATTSTRTVTMNQTAATDYGSANIIFNRSSSALSVCNRGTVTYGTTGGVNYLLRLSGNLNVYSGGTFRIGNTGGAEIPRTSTAVLEFDCGADGDFGLWLRNGATFTAYGLSRTSGKDEWMCTLTADSGVADTTLDVDTDTGWLNADEIAIASTSQTLAQHERKILNGAAGAALLTITVGLASAKLGSGDYHGEVILLTRNVEIRSVSTTNVTFVRFGQTATCACEWVSFRYAGSSTQFFEIDTASPGSLTLRYCILQDFDREVRVVGTTHGNWTIDQCAMYNQRGASGGLLQIVQTSGTWTLTDFVGIFQNSVSAALELQDVGGTIGNLWISSAGAVALNWTEESVEGGNGPTFPANTTWVFHSSAAGLLISASTRNITFPRIETWHCSRANYVSGTIWLDNVEFNGGFWLGNGPGAGEEACGFWVNGQAGINDLRFRGIDIAADSTFASNWGILFDKGRIVATNLQFIDCNFSQTSGTRRQIAQADIAFIADVAPGTQVGMGIATNCTFNSAGTPVSFFYAAGPVPSRNSKYSAIRCPKFNGSATAHRTYTPRATCFIETGTVDVTPGLRIDPLEGAAVPFDSNCYQPGWGFCVPVLSGQTVTVSVKVQKSAGYNGSTEPQLVLLANAQLGIAADTVIDTLSVGSGSWETLTGTTAAAAADGVMEFVVRTYGTAGSVFVDTWDAV